MFSMHWPFYATEGPAASMKMLHYQGTHRCFDPRHSTETQTNWVAYDERYQKSQDPTKFYQAELVSLHPQGLLKTRTENCENRFCRITLNFWKTNRSKSSWTRNSWKRWRVSRSSLCRRQYWCYQTRRIRWNWKKDVCDVHVGFEHLQEDHDRMTKPTKYLSRSFTNSKLLYDTMQQDCVAIVWSVLLHRFFLGWYDSWSERITTRLTG